MEASNEVKIISMLGEMNNKITEIGLNIKDIRERMSKNFNLVVDAQNSTNEKIDKIVESIDEIKFRLSVTEAGVGLNSSRIKEIAHINK